MADICNYGHNRCYDIRYIQPSPKARLPYDYIRIADFGVIENGQGCGYFEHRRRAKLAVRDFLDQRTQLIR
ncbi:hypothetical protein D3C81_2260520 [compost metagenome]